MNAQGIDGGESPYAKRHGKGPFTGKLLPFGSLVTFLPRPEALKRQPKFENKGRRGILVGYRLHNGGKWTKDYLVFPLTYFDDYDYHRPRNMLELAPILTQEVEQTMPAGVSGYVFPLKQRYDAFRNAPLSSQLCMITSSAKLEPPTGDDDAVSANPDALVQGGITRGPLLIPTSVYLLMLRLIPHQPQALLASSLLYPTPLRQMIANRLYPISLTTLQYPLSALMINTIFVRML